MKTKQGKSAGVRAVVKVGALGGVITVMVLLLLTAVITFFVESNRVPIEYETTAALVVRVLAFFVGSAVSAAIAKEGKLQVVAIAMLTGLITVIALTVFLWDGMKAQTWLGVLECVLAGSAGLFLNMLPQKRKRTAKMRYR